MSHRTRQRRKRTYVNLMLEFDNKSARSDVSIELNSDVAPASSSDPPNDNCTYYRSSSEEHLDSAGQYEVNSDTEDEEEARLNLLEEVRTWALAENITTKALSLLLGILQKHNVEDNIPKDARTLLNVSKQKAKIIEFGSGKYAYFGVENGVLRRAQSGLVFSSLPNLNNFLCFNPQDILTVTVGIDGLPISRSSRKQFWPLLAKLDQANNSTPFLVALWLGDEKPDIKFIHEFVEECVKLERIGIEISGKKYHFRVSCVVADAPARSCIKCVIGHNGTYGCERCTAKGCWSESRMLFCNLDAPLRDNSAFRRQSQKKHHKGNTPLLQLSLDVVRQVSLDYLHLCLLGVMRKLLRVWTKDKSSHRLGKRERDALSERVVYFSSFIPTDFVRKGRSLTEIDNFKATEFRLLLLYTGPSVFRSILPADKYEHFLLLSCAIYILLLNLKSHSWVSCAENLIRKFVSEVPGLYSEKLMVYNFHSLIHLTDDCYVYGSIERISAFDFENYMQTLKRLLRGRNNYMEQIVNRIAEIETYRDGIFVSSSVNINCDFNLESLLKEGNNVVLLIDGSVVLIESIWKDLLVGRKFTVKEPCEGYPIDSRLLEISMVSRLTLNNFTFRLSEIRKKCMCLPESSDRIRFMCVPLVHDLVIDNKT